MSAKILTRKFVLSALACLAGAQICRADSVSTYSGVTFESGTQLGGIQVVGAGGTLGTGSSLNGVVVSSGATLTLNSSFSSGQFMVNLLNGATLRTAAGLTVLGGTNSYLAINNGAFQLGGVTYTVSPLTVSQGSSTQWQPSGTGTASWGDAANWSAGVPVSQGLANFNSPDAAPIAIDGNYVAGSMLFSTIVQLGSGTNVLQSSGSASSGYYTFAISSTSSLTLDFNGVIDPGNSSPHFANSGSLIFSGPQASAGDAQIDNQSGASLVFDRANAGGATIVNHGTASFSGGASNSGQAIITNASGALLTFSNTSLMAGGTLTNSGTTLFQTSARQQGGALLNQQGGVIRFSDQSGLSYSGTLVNSGQAIWQDQSNVIGATITNNANGTLSFTGNSTSSAFLTNSGTVLFQNLAQQNGGSIANAQGGVIRFADQSGISGSGSLTNSGQITWLDQSRVALDIKNNAGGSMIFTGSSDASYARIDNSGTLDVSGHSPTVQIATVAGTGDVYLGGNNLVVGAGSSYAQISGRIRDGGLSGGTGGSLTLVGSGTLALLGDNTYTGTTTITQGSVLILGDGHTTGSIVGDVDVEDSLVFNHSNLLTYGGIISGSGYTFQVGTGTTVLTGNNTSQNGVGIYSGVLRLGNGGTSGSVTGQIFDNATLEIDRSDRLDLNLTIYGAGRLVQVGSGTTVLSGSNTYTGGTVLQAGALALGSAKALGTSGTISFTGGTLQYSASGTTDYSSRFSKAAGQQYRLDTAGQNAALASSLNGAAASFTKLGDGILTLKGSNSFTAGIALQGGLVGLGSSTALGSSGTISFQGGGLQFSAANRGDYSARFSHAASQHYLLDTNGQSVILASALTSAGGTLEKTGLGTLILTGSNTFNGITTIDSGILQIGNAGTTGSLQGALVTNGTALFYRSNALEYDQTISGSGAVAKSGAGSLTLGGHNTYSGGTILNTGTLNLATADALGAGKLTIAGVSTLDNTSGHALALANDIAQAWNANFTFKGSNDLDLGDGNVVLNATRGVTVASHTLTVGGIISGSTASAGLIKSGTGALVLTGQNTYGGATTISAGTLQLGAGGSTGSLGAGAIVDNSVLDVNRSNALTLANPISGIGRLVKDGGGTLTLTGANSFSGGTILNAGQIVLGNAKALGSAAGLLTLNGGNLDLHGFTVSVGPLSGSSGTVTNNGAASAQLTVAQAKDGVFAGTLSDGLASLALAKSGAGALTLSGSNSHSGGTILSAGTLNLANADALGTGKLTIAGISTIDNASGHALALDGDITQAWNANFTFKGSNDLDLGDGNVVLNATRGVTVASHTLTVGGIISGSTASTGLIKSGTGTLILAGNNTYNGVTTISAGTLQLGTGSTTGKLGTGAIANNGVLDLNRSNALALGNTISGVGRLVKDGAGALTLSGANSFSGGTTLNAGQLILGNAKALGAATGLLTLNGGSLDLHGFAAAVGILSGTAGTITNNGTTLGKLTVAQTKDATFAGRLTDGTGAVALAKTGAGALTLSGSNTFSGGTTLSAGTLNLANTAALGRGPLTFAGVSTIDNASGQALALANDIAQAWNANFTFKGSNDLDLGSGNVRLSATHAVTVASHTLTVGGVISGSTASTGLIKSGTGTLLLTGANTYGGATTISAGTLQLGNGGAGGSLGAGAIADNGTLAVNQSSDLTLANALSGVGKLVKNGSGILTLSGANSYSGGTTLNSGGLNLGSAKALGAASGDLAVNGGTLDLKGNSLTVGSLSGAGGKITSTGAGAVKLTINGAKSGTFLGQITDSPGTPVPVIGGGVGLLSLRSNVATSDITVSGPPIGGGGSGIPTMGPLTLVKAGSGNLTLSGTNTYSGGTVLSGGGLFLGSASALGGGSLLISGVSTIDNVTGSSLTIGNIEQNWYANFTFKGSDALNLGYGAVLLNATHTVTVTSSTLTVEGNISGATTSTGLVKAGAGTLLLTQDNTYRGVTTISAGTLILGKNDNGTGSLASSAIVNNGQLVFNHGNSVGYGGNISGRGSVVQSGTGRAILSGNNSYTGGTVLNAGQLVVGSAKALGAGSVTLNAGTLLTDGTQQKINVGGNLIWNSDARISLTMNGPMDMESVAVAGSLVALGDGPLTFDFQVQSGPAANYLVMTVAHGFGSLTADDFAFDAGDAYPFIGGFFIQGNSLYFSQNATNQPGGATISLFASTGFSANFASAMAVPEPSTWALVALGFLAGGFFRYRSSRA